MADILRFLLPVLVGAGISYVAWKAGFRAGRHWPIAGERQYLGHVIDAGGGQIGIMVDPKTETYPTVGARVGVTSYD